MTTLLEKDFKVESKPMLPPKEFLYDNASKGCPSHNYFPSNAVIPSLPLTIKWLRDCVREHPSTRLQVYEWMTLQKDTKLVEGDYVVHLDLITKVRGLNSAEKFFEDLPDKMRGQPTCTALLHAYVQNDLVDKAEALVEKMSECGFMRSPLPYNHMMSLYISKGKLDKVSKLFEKLKINASPDVVTFNLLLTACATEDDVETAER